MYEFVEAAGTSIEVTPTGELPQPAHEMANKGQSSKQAHEGARWIREYMGQDAKAQTPTRTATLRRYFREGGSEKHLRDIRSMLMISGPQINQEDLLAWVARRRLEPQWERAHGS